MVPLLLAPASLLLACAGTPQHDLGADGGALAPCPDSPNCVSSLEEPTDAEHYIAPIAITGSPDEALDRAVEIIGTMKRAEVVERDGPWLHATFTSALFRFVDDVELLVDGDTLHVRSASRVGRSDLGVNRERVEAFRAAFQGQ